jgi:glycerate kinase
MGKGWEVDSCPLADGGDGFADVLTQSAGGSKTRLTVAGPRGEPVAASIGFVPLERLPGEARVQLGAVAGEPGGSIAVIEMAAASGLALLAPGARDPLLASSWGTGELIRFASGARVRAILLGVGGSATHDLGLGALAALGIGFTTSAGIRLNPPTPATWPRIRSIDGRISGCMPPILIACDVDNPLLGPRGAVAAYGSQKGLKAEDAPALEVETARMASLVCRHFGQPESLMAVPGAGAAGGIAFSLMAAAGATLLNGFDLVASWLGLDARLADADIVLTGEGRFDDTSLRGKGPGAVVRRARALGKSVHVFAGQISLTGDFPGLESHAINPPGLPLADALAQAPALLALAVERAMSGQ